MQFEECEVHFLVERWCLIRRQKHGNGRQLLLFEDARSSFSNVSFAIDILAMFMQHEDQRRHRSNTSTIRNSTRSTIYVVSYTGFLIFVCWIRYLSRKRKHESEGARQKISQGQHSWAAERFRLSDDRRIVATANPTTASRSTQLRRYLAFNNRICENGDNTLRMSQLQPHDKLFPLPEAQWFCC